MEAQDARIAALEARIAALEAQIAFKAAQPMTPPAAPEACFYINSAKCVAPAGRRIVMLGKRACPKHRVVCATCYQWLLDESLAREE